MNLNKTLLLTLVITTTVLSGCDSAEKRREACTEARHISVDAAFGRADKSKAAEARETWVNLKCQPSDIIYPQRGGHGASVTAPKVNTEDGADFSDPWHPKPATPHPKEN